MKDTSKFFTLLLCILSVNLNAQNSCETDFKFIVNKIKRDYPAYAIKVNPELKKLEKKISNKIKNNPDSCFHYLQEYTTFFKDRHLKITEIKNADKRENIQNEFSTYGKNVHLNIESLQSDNLKSNSLEGIWEYFNEKIAILKDNNSYIGVVIDKKGWKKGQVAYGFSKNKNGNFTTELFNLYGQENNSNVQASLHQDGNILELENFKYFVRDKQDDKMNKASLYTYLPSQSKDVNVFFLALPLSDSTFYLRTPDFFSETSNELVKKHLQEIIKYPNLIIDIRGNFGGQDKNYKELMKLIYSTAYISKGVEWYASEGNIELFENTLKTGKYKNGEKGREWINSLLKKMKKHKGEFVVHPQDEDRPELFKMDTVLPLPKRVGIIISEDNASTAEQFLLEAKQSGKVMLFGNKNTAGILDYSNITAVDLPSKRYKIFNPMTRSKRLPDNPIDNVGIAPDIFIPFKENNRKLYDRIDDWVYFVKNYLEIPD